MGRGGCAPNHDLLGSNGRPGGARHSLGNWPLKPARDDGARYFSHYAAPQNASFFSEHTISNILSFPATMAPPKTAAPKKGKAPMQASKPAAASGSAAPQGALEKSRVGSVGIDKVRYLDGAETNEHGATHMEPAGSRRVREGYYPIFLDRKSVV